MYGHLTPLDLADVCMDETIQVDVLIGLDCYWEFVTGETIRGDSGPIAINTTLG